MSTKKINHPRPREWYCPGPQNREGYWLPGAPVHDKKPDGTYMTPDEMKPWLNPKWDPYNEFCEHGSQSAHHYPDYPDPHQVEITRLRQLGLSEREPSPL